MKRFLFDRALPLLCAALAWLLLPMTFGGQWLQIVTSTICFALAASGIGFMYSRLGMVSLAQVGLMGVGGWVMLRMNHGLSLPFEINLAVSAAVTMGFGWVMAMPALRMRGLYLALVTLMAASGLEIVFSTFRFPNGGEGFWGVMPSLEASFRRPWLATEDVAYLRYVLVMLAVGFLLIELHGRAAPGRAWAMIRRSEAAAMASGVNVVYYKAWAFGLSGLLAGIAGGLLAGTIGMLDPATFRASESIMLFALAVVGGARHWLGAVLAAVLYRMLPGLFNSWGLAPELALMFFGAALLHALMNGPEGMAGQLLGLLRRTPRSTT